MTTRKKATSKSKPPRKSPDIPVTAAMLNEARYELKAEITSFRLEVNARFKQVDARFERVDARFEQIDARFEQIDARFEQVEASILSLKSEVAKVLAAVHRVGLLVEEQNARNKYALDGYASLSERMDEWEKKSDRDT